MFDYRTTQLTFFVATLVVGTYLMVFIWCTMTELERSRYHKLSGRNSEAVYNYQDLWPALIPQSVEGYARTTAGDHNAIPEAGLAPPQEKHASSLTAADEFEPITKRKGIVIFTGKRSGSSFVGGIFSHHPKIYYVYEPLRILSRLIQIKAEMTGKQLPETNFTRLALSKIFERLDCHLNYSVEWRSGLLETAIESCHERRNQTTDIFCGRLRQLEDVARISRSEEICREREVVAVKLIRVQDIADLRPLTEWMDLRVIHLVRDPRPTEVSRIKTRPNHDLIRRKGTDARDEVDLCDHLDRNLQYWLDTPRWLRGKYLLVRYEDIVTSVTEKAREMMEFVGYNLHEDVIQWIDKSTNCDARFQRCNGTFGTARNSTGILDKWRKHTDWGFVRRIQDTCAKVMGLLGYVPFNNDGQLRNISISALRALAVRGPE